MMLRVKETQIHANIARKESIRYWHERLAHQNIAHVKRFLNRNNVSYVDEKGFQCEACIFGKQHRLPFPVSESKSEKCGDIIHTDLCGPMSTSLGGSKLYLLLKDDRSHFRFVYFIRHKNEAEEKIASFVKFVHTQTQHKIKILRSDNGGEYIGKNFEKFLKRTAYGTNTQSHTHPNKMVRVKERTVQ